ncbi:MAG: Response regulator [Phormidesmis priestleyi Ana]|uniref:Response regulator n=1 Tax=Phormidesmis priestleyi Ana TaxID=1666911 RepID=A0A0P8DDL7_9CYAN|nr:MAG: Response regulator [Phormidesmis priestleyi Ana]
MSHYACSTPDNRHNKILVVDDIPDNLFLMDVILGEQENYDLTCVDNGIAALDAVEQTPPDLVLLDVMMPGMDGYEVTRRIRQNKNLPYIPIFLVTADDNINEEVALAAGADGFIRKPFDIDKMVVLVQKALTNSCVCV